MSEELLPCSFCGESNAVICETEHFTRPAYAVTCRTKGCAGGVYMMGHGEFVSVGEAIKAWNTRPDSKPEYKWKNYEEWVNGRKIFNAFAAFNAARERKEG